MAEKKNLIQHLEFVYNILLKAEKEFENTENQEIKNTIENLIKETKELINNNILEDASKNGVTSENIGIYKMSKEKVAEIYAESIKLNRMIGSENCYFIVKMSIESLGEYIKNNLQNKMNNKIENYHKKYI